ncbi:MAG: DNA-binding transcriptional regulator [Planctomycetia bacterium]|nr:DNA-binding transcriptional regulator [Planctomycetia bacterium]
MTPLSPLQAYKVPKVAIFIETSSMYGRQLLKGIGRYIRQHEPWEIFMEPQAVYEHVPQWTKSWQGDGIISRLDNPEFIQRIRKFNVPVIDLNDGKEGRGFPVVRCDHRRVGVMAAEHMLASGLTRFAVVGNKATFWCNERILSFKESVKQSSASCAYFNLPFDRFHSEHPHEEVSLHRWLLSLEKPIGIFACYDMQAVQILNACHRLKIKVPGDISLLSVGNEDVVSEFCYPSLSTIALAPEKIGFLAAEQLDLLMRGMPLASEVRLVPPTSVILRESTNTQSQKEPIVAEALTLIRQHATKGLTIDQLTKMMCISRSTLQRKFRLAYGQTVHDCILETRLEKAKLLLLETDLSCSSIAFQCGFENETYFYYVFKKQNGLTCRKFRQASHS